MQLRLEDKGLRSPAAALMNEVVANELTDRVQQRKWEYLIEKREGKQILTEEQVDTKDGPLYRVLAIDGVLLDHDQRQQDNARMDRLMHDPTQQLKSKLAHDEDEAKLEKVLRLMPQAFIYDYDESRIICFESSSVPTPATILQPMKPELCIA